MPMISRSHRGFWPANQHRASRMGGWCEVIPTSMWGTPGTSTLARSSSWTRQPNHRTRARKARPTCWHRSTTRSIARSISAYGYWETPPSPYAQFVQGYADTASVQLIVQLPTFIDVGAGNAYASIPAVLIATRRDGSQQMFAGCYTTHKVNIQPDVWHLARATIAPAAAQFDIPSALAQA